ncbi:unnamed protein product [Lepeophtheirus salmonis]|uniref:(salmon louse) hypothetical protein n=2 Tax=Lepeophtheirus salmonis TaxID=72036 RepID=A0A7R8H4Y6_LEPSM|nr:unnamed protein product [Lepeophtheirus salmonis]CAF2871326.1 unnamed protein product [Lepeophtheirus salmonis]
MSIFISHSIIIFILSKLTLIHSLRIQDLSFPEYVMLGQTVTMYCEYYLGDGEYVDSIKWYKDNHEFYRIVPQMIGPNKVRTFDMDGVKIDLENSGISKIGKKHELVLQDVTLDSSGEFRCQITQSSTPFHTENRDRNLTVIIRPEKGPIIQGLKAIYMDSDDSLNILCTSHRSLPASVLDFFINDEPVSESMKQRYPIKLDKSGDGLQTSSIGLHYPLRTRNTPDIILRVKCTAKIGNAYWESVVQETVLKRHEHALESRSNGSPVHHSSIATLTTTILISALALTINIGFL